LTDWTGFDGAPTWSPDGLYLAFQSDRDGNTEIYRLGIEGGGLQRLTNSGEPDTDPAWSR
jgi:TolB protein